MTTFNSRKNKIRRPKKINLLTDNNTENISINESLNKKDFSYSKIPLIRKNLKNNFVVQKFPTILNSRRRGNSISEIQKYFVDLQTYRKQEEEELLKRKSFYDFVEDLIDEIEKKRRKRNKIN